MGLKTADQEEDAAFPVSFSLPWLDAGRRVSDVMVSNGCVSSLSSSQRSMLSEDHESAPLDSPFAFAGAVGAMVGLVKNEESFDCLALSLFGFDAPAAVDALVLGPFVGLLQRFERSLS